MISSQIISPSDLTTAIIEEMYFLMTENYRNVVRPEFEQDLEKKQHVLILYDGKSICGFSTQAIWDYSRAEKKAVVVFSGDTIIDKRARASRALPFAFAQYLHDILSREPDTPLYWLLTSKGFRTYRSLPVFFCNFFPSRNGQITDCEKKFLEEILLERFPQRFERNSWILKASPGSQTIKHTEDMVEASQRVHPDLEYFLQLNPDYANGDELACFARFEKKNIKPALWKRMFGS